MQRWPESPEDLRRFILQFEEGQWPKKCWNHRAHVTMSAYYLIVMPLGEAVRHIKEGIVRYNGKQGTPNTQSSGYHETLTSFWIAMIASVLPMKGNDVYASVVEIADRFGHQRALYEQYYSFDVARDRVSRASWVAPDLQSLPCPAGTLKVEATATG